MNTLRRWSHWVESEFDDCKAGLSIFRILFALLGLASVPNYGWLTGLPDSFFYPPLGVAMFFSEFPDPAFAYLLDFVKVAALVLVLFGAHTFSASMALGIVGIVGSGFAFSLGKIDHNIFGMLVPFVGGFAGWGARLSVDAMLQRKSVPAASWPLCIFAVAVSFTMLTAAIPKVETGWLAWESQSVLGHMIHNYHVVDRHTWLAEQMFKIEAWWFWELQDWATIFFEGGFVFFVWNLRSFRFFCALAVFFHLGVYYSMDIFFSANLVAYGMFVPWEKLIPKKAGALAAAVRDGATSITGPRVLYGLVLVLAAGVAWWTMEQRNPLYVLFGAVGISIWTWTRYLTIALAIFVVVWGGLQLIGVLPRRRAASGETPIVLFDGVCGLCNNWVDFILKIDRRGVVRFASLQSGTGTRLLREHGLKEGYLDSIVLVQNGRALTKSDAVLEVMRVTGTVWSVVNVFSVLPRYFRDAVYNLIAANRYRIFGKHETCRLPSPEERARFVDL